MDRMRGCFSLAVGYLTELSSRPIRMKTRKLLRVTVLLVLLVAVGLWLRNELGIDSCLDRGGSWDKERQMCVGAEK